jgi:two-component system KDP operon response regulator KdpE
MTLSRGKVLVVDDDSAIRRALHNTLHGMGFDVDDASSGEAALDVVRDAGYDVVLMDINMPGIGGIRACREIRKSLPRLGIVMLTVRDGEEDKVTALDAGADDYITKPFNIRELAARIRAAVRRSSAAWIDPDAAIRIGNIELDPARRLVNVVSVSEVGDPHSDSLLVRPTGGSIPCQAAASRLASGEPRRGARTRKWMRA